MKRRTLVNGWLFIPSSMVFAAFVWGVVQEVPGIMLKSMEVSNEVIGLTSLLSLPLAIRFLFGPFVDHRGTKRRWVLSSQSFITAAMLGLAAFCCSVILFDWGVTLLPFLLGLFLVLSFCSVFQDIAWGGFFLTAVDEREKALFVGINTAFIRLAILFSQGFMVMLAGRIEAVTGMTMAGWAVCFGVLGGIQLVLLVYHHLVYPYPVLDRALGKEEHTPFIQVFRKFFEVPGAVAILLFMFLYRLGEGLLARMKVPFLMDDPSAGGLGISLEQVGVLNGVFAVFAMVLGGVIGGLLIKFYGLRRTIWPFALLMTLPNLAFVWLALAPHYGTASVLGFTVNPWALGVLVFEAFGYGVAFASMGFLQCEASRGPYRATFFALLTSVMMFSWILTGTISGFVEAWLGYPWLFTLSVVLAVPGIACIAWLPLRQLEAMGQAEDAARHRAS